MSEPLEPSDEQNASSAVPTITGRIEYDRDRRRLLRVTAGADHGWRTGEWYTASFVFNPKAPTTPHVDVGWHAPFTWPRPRQGGHARAVRVLICPTGPALIAQFQAGEEPLGVDHPFPGDPARWIELLSVARQVAANRAPAIGILGFIEDNMPEPWSALATATPLRLFRALCPIAPGPALV